MHSRLGTDPFPANQFESHLIQHFIVSKKVISIAHALAPHRGHCGKGLSREVSLYRDRQWANSNTIFNVRFCHDKKHGDKTDHITRVQDQETVKSIIRLMIIT